MNVQKKKKRIFGTGILLLMLLLTASTMVAFATGERSGNSYSLKIEKIFADGTPEEAKNRQYTFLVQGEAKKQDGTVVKQINETVTLPEEQADGSKKWEGTITAEAPITATVTEVTSGIEVSQDGKNYNMQNTKCVTEALLLGTQKLQLKNAASITLGKPEKEGNKSLTTSWFHIYNEPYPGHHDVIEKLDTVVEIVPGSEEIVFNKLSAGVYTVEELMAPDGYSVLVGPREAVVNAGDKGEFHINGNPGRVTIKAGGTENDGGTHYYTIDRQKQSDDEKNQISFVPRTSLVKSGETWVNDDLPKGSYTVTEHTYAGKSGYTVTVPNKSTKLVSRSGYVTQLSSTNARRWGTFTAKYPDQTEYIRITGFGKLLDGNNKALSASDTYATVHYGISTPAGIVRKGGYANSTPFKGSSTYTIGENNQIDVILDTNKVFGFSVTGVKSTAAAKLVVSWDEYGYADPQPSTVKKSFGVSVTKTVDGRGWMLFSKDADSSQGAENLTYHYEITSSDQKSVANCFVTDANDNPMSSGMTRVNDYTIKLDLKPGQSIKLNGLKKGTYSITESVDQDKADGFSMEVTGCAVNVTEANTPYEIKVQGPRPLTIGKPSCVDGGVDDHGRIYTFRVSGPNNYIKDLEIHAGETVTTDPLPGSGTYTVVPTNEAEPFKMVYSDSTTVTGTASGPSATITFKNVFNTGEGSYRYIHEYYLKHEDGSYTYEGSNSVTHVRGLELDENTHFQGVDLTEEPNFVPNQNVSPNQTPVSYTYTHFSEGYGLVDVPSEDESEEQDSVAAVSILSPEELEEAEDPALSEVTGDTEEDSEEPGQEEQPDQSDESSNEPEDSSGSKEDSGASEDSSGSKEEGGASEDSSGGKEEGKEPGDSSGSKEEGKEPGDSSGSKEEGKEPGDSSDSVKGDEEPENPSDGKAEGKNTNASSDDAGDVTDQVSLSGGNEDMEGLMVLSVSNEGNETPNASLGSNEADKDPDTSSDSNKGEETPDTSSGDKEGDKKPNDPSEGSEAGEGTGTPSEGSGGEEKPEDSSDSDTGKENTDAPSDSNEEEKEPDNSSDGSEGEEEGDTSSDSEDTDILPDGEEEITEDGVLSPEENKSRKRSNARRDADETPVLRPATPGSDGILVEGNGVELTGSNDADKNTISYKVMPNMNYANVTAEGSNIIILRYFRELPEDKKGTYKVVHEYYYRDDKGDHWEGSSALTSEEGQLEHLYYADSVERFDTFTPADGRMYTYTFDGRPQYGVVNPDHKVTESGYSGNPSDGYTGLDAAGQGYRYRPDTDKVGAAATEDGSQIIILRYFREVRGAYNIVHEYYVRRPSEDTSEKEENATDGDEDNAGSGETGISLLSGDGALDGSDPSVDPDSLADPDSPADAGSPGDSGSVEDTGSTGAALDENSGYVYTLEGVRDIDRIRAKLDTTHEGTQEDWKLEYNSRAYQYHSVVYGEKQGETEYEAIANKQWATATEDSDQIIILRYFREAGPNDPDIPDKPDEPENPETPEEPETPDRPGGSDDPDDHDRSKEPDTPEDSDDPGRAAKSVRPKDSTGLKQAEGKDDVSGADKGASDAPATGDDSHPLLWSLLAVGCFTGLALLRRSRRRKS